jgi:ABC-2 type transport system permease protein
VADALALYGRLIAARVRSQFQYRVSFALDAIGMFLVAFLDFAAVLLIFHATPRLGAFSVHEVAFLYATSGLSFAFAELFVGHLDTFPQQIRDGSFDLVLLRPRGTLFQVIASDFQLRRVGMALEALVILVWAIGGLSIPWNVARVAVTIMLVAAGTVIFVAVWVFMICIVFWSVEGRETANAFTYGGKTLTQYPVDVYGRWLRRLLAFVIPMAFVSYYPALYVLDKPDPLGLPSWLQFCSPVAAVAAGTGAAAMWRTAVRHYRSAGG